MQCWQRSYANGSEIRRTAPCCSGPSSRTSHSRDHWSDCAVANVIQRFLRCVHAIGREPTPSAGRTFAQSVEIKEIVHACPLVLFSMRLLLDPPFAVGGISTVHLFSEQLVSRKSLPCFRHRTRFLGRSRSSGEAFAS